VRSTDDYFSTSVSTHLRYDLRIVKRGAPKIIHHPFVDFFKFELFHLLVL